MPSADRRPDSRAKLRAKAKAGDEDAAARVQANDQRENAERRAKSPEKVRARQIIRNNIYRGKMVRQPCEVCGDPKSHAHHDDYSKPLDVIWLCSAHHTERHAHLAALGSQDGGSSSYGGDRTGGGGGPK